MINILVPWGLFLLCGGILLCFIVRRYKIGLAGIVLLLCLNWCWHIFAVDLSLPIEHKHTCSLKVMSWNICSTHTTDKDVECQIISMIRNQEVDVVFVTEYREALNPEIDSVLRLLYPYRGNITNTYTFGDFYSRIPIDTCLRIGGTNDGHLFRYDLGFSDSTLRLYCLHMHSNNLVDGDYFSPDNIKDKVDVKRYLKNYETAAAYRMEQAKLVVEDISAEPTIVMGDMNDVYGSPCMQVFADAGLRDAWWDGGFGYGATFHDPLPYRIDHVLYSKGLKLRSVKKVDAKGLSDHDALVAEFEVY